MCIYTQMDSRMLWKCGCVKKGVQLSGLCGGGVVRINAVVWSNGSLMMQYIASHVVDALSRLRFQCVWSESQD